MLVKVSKALKSQGAESSVFYSEYTVDSSKRSRSYGAHEQFQKCRTSDLDDIYDSLKESDAHQAKTILSATAQRR